MGVDDGEDPTQTLRFTNAKDKPPPQIVVRKEVPSAIEAFSAYAGQAAPAFAFLRARGDELTAEDARALGITWQTLVHGGLRKGHIGRVGWAYERWQALLGPHDQAFERGVALSENERNRLGWPPPASTTPRRGLFDTWGIRKI